MRDLDPASLPALPLDATQLQELLPHRPPFFFLRELNEWEPGHSARSTVEFAGDEFFFAGHFPGNPLVPGVILTEAAAQTAGLALQPGGGVMGGTFVWLAKVRSMRFRAAVRPRERLHIEARVTQALGGVGNVAVRILRGEECVADGELVLAGTKAAGPDRS